MLPFDFQNVPTGTALPLREAEFRFAVNGVTVANVSREGIFCETGAILLLNAPTNTIELSIVNGVNHDAYITAWCLDSTGWHDNPIGPIPDGVQPVRFNLPNIRSVTIDCPFKEFRLQRIS
jgi:hypothetical protein